MVNQPPRPTVSVSRVVRHLSSLLPPDPPPRTHRLPPFEKQYQDACARLGPAWFEYDDLQLNWGRQDFYEVTRKVGRGKYSEVFEGVDIRSNSLVVLKVRPRECVALV